MRVAVISDIHGNLHALESVLSALEPHSPEEIWCLGDLVGYGPRPNECVALVAQQTSICLVGNHDLGVLGRIDLAEFSPDAEAGARWTRSVLSPENRVILESLPSSAETPHGAAQLFHASPRDPVWEYVLSAQAARDALEATSAPLVLVGHSHVPLAIRPKGRGVAGGIAPGGFEVELEGRWLLNPGSVGQPRDGDPRAAVLLLDLERRFAKFHRVAYPIERTQRELREHGLPEPLALRLEHGM
ncbi:MAG: metallophosphoesterase family protein [Actinobacteria bacterium]|nr:metallophosphoesterase family protein [Actinomycetota bacterium]